MLQRHLTDSPLLIAALLLFLAVGAGTAFAEDSDDLARAEALADRASNLEKQGLYDEAIPLTQEALSIREKTLGADDPQLAKSLNNLAALYVDKGRFADAEPLYRRGIAILEKAHGPDDPDVATLLDNLANLQRVQGRYREAEDFARRALAIREKAFGEEHAKVAQSLNAVGAICYAEGNYTEAAALFQRSLAISQKVLSPDDPAIANVLNDLAVVDADQGRYTESETLYAQARTILEKAYGPDHPDVGRLLNNLAEVYVAEARYSEAEPLLKRSAEIREKALGSDHPDVGESLENLAQLYYLEGRNAEAEPLYKKSLALHEKALGPDNPTVATALSNLAAVFVAEGRGDEAEPLLKRSLAIREQALGPDHPDVAISLNNLGELYRTERRYTEAEPLYLRSIAIWEKAFGPDHPDRARALNNLADVYRNEGRFAEAEAGFKQSLTIFEKAFGNDHPIVALVLNNLAALYDDENRDTEAEPLFRRSLAIARQAYGPEHHDIAYALWNLAALCRKQHRIGEARDLVAEADNIVARRIAIAGGSRSDDDRGGDQREFRALFLLSVALAPAQDQAAALSFDDSFRVAQLAQASSTARAVAGMAARFASGSGALAATVRQRQDAAAQWHTLDNALVQVASKPQAQRDAAAEEALRQHLAQAGSELDALDTRIARDFPAFAELSNPKPVDAAAVQQVLAPDEALLVYLVGRDESWLWAVRRDRTALFRLAIGSEALTNAVTALRQRLDPELNPDLQPFDTQRAYELYQSVLAPASPLLEGAHLVFVVPDGPLQSLPLGVLVTQKPGPAPSGTISYRDVAWFAKAHATAVLPSVGAVRELRQYAGGAPAPLPFVGIGDPVLGSQVASEREAKPASFFRGAQGDVAALRTLPSLPETADELRAVGKATGAGESDLYLGERATEPLLRTAKLDQYRIVEFATHGLMSGDLKGLAEPALVLTPPETPVPDDDGLLTVSKIAMLKLNADWVVLSACNTADDGTPDAGGLSGLAQAFFYAGARSILVSHWSVASEATVKLITGAFGELKQHPEIGRAEALRRAETAMLDTANPSEFAHPLFWAPFVVMGEGGAGH
jgi:CHAT domain-containing protein/tetratricopeptide (TPR) repeat protein